MRKVEAAYASKGCSTRCDEPLSLILLGEKWSAGGFALRVAVRFRARARLRLRVGVRVKVMGQFAYLFSHQLSNPTSRSLGGWKEYNCEASESHANTTTR